jgi:hypothetical protein
MQPPFQKRKFPSYKPFFFTFFYSNEKVIVSELFLVHSTEFCTIICGIKSGEKKWAEILKENGERRICSSHVIIASIQKMEAKTDS